MWSSDGTPTGTVALPELPNSSFTNVQPFTDINGKLIIVPNLSAFGAISGRFWSCDSSENITLINVGALSSYGTLFKFNEALYFEGSNPDYKLFRYGLPINLGTENHAKNHYRVFPNPTSDFFTIQSENGFFTDASVTVTTTLRQLILKKDTITSTEINLDLSTQSPGMYLLTIEENDTKIIQKIIKK